mgnify:CR=1 FL=1
MIEFSEEQKLAISKAQETFLKIKEDADLLNDKQLDLLFGQARSMNGWKDQDVSNEILYSCLLYTSPSPRD